MSYRNSPKTLITLSKTPVLHSALQSRLRFTTVCTTAIPASVRIGWSPDLTPFKQDSEDEFKTSKMASTFDHFFGGSATVVDSRLSGNRVPSPSRPSDVDDNGSSWMDACQDPVCSPVSRNSSGGHSWRPEGVTDLIIPAEKKNDPSDDPLLYDEFSPQTLLDGGEKAASSHHHRVDDSEQYGIHPQRTVFSAGM